jgi:hypothetical protein
MMEPLPQRRDLSTAPQKPSRKLPCSISTLKSTSCERTPLMRHVRTIRAALLLLFGVAGLGSVWNQIAHAYYSRRATPSGQIYTIDGHRMHLYCTGAGAPTVVLEGALGDTWIGWQQVQPALSSVTRVCSYVLMTEPVSALASQRKVRTTHSSQNTGSRAHS